MFNILHLSDLHLHNGGPTYELDIKTKFFKLVSAIKRNDLNPDIIVVSGDITNKSDAVGFKLFEEIIKGALNRFSLSEDRVVISVGNHDLNYDETSSLVEIKRNPNGECNVKNGFNFERLANNSNFLNPFKRYIEFNRIFYKHSAEIKDNNILAFFKHIAGINFIVINSCWAERSYERGIEKACIACNQIKFLINEYLQKRKNEVNVAVLHHPHTKICEYCIYYYEQETVLENLYSLTDLVLCGDIHSTCKPKQMKDKGAYECIVGNGGITENTSFAIYSVTNWGQEMRYNYLTLNNDEWVLSSPQDKLKLRPKFHCKGNNLNKNIDVSYKAYHGTKEKSTISIKLFFIRLYKIVLHADDDFAYENKLDINGYDIIDERRFEAAMIQSIYDINGSVIETDFDGESRGAFLRLTSDVADYLVNKNLLCRDSSNQFRITQNGIKQFDLEIKKNNV